MTASNDAMIATNPAPNPAVDQAINPATNVAMNPNNPAQQQPQQEGMSIGSTLRMVMRGFIMYSVIKFVMNSFGIGGNPTHQAIDPLTNQTSTRSSVLYPAWQDGVLFDLHVYLTDIADWNAQSYFSEVNDDQLVDFVRSNMIWSLHNLRYEDEALFEYEIAVVKSLLSPRTIRDKLSGKLTNTHVELPVVDDLHSDWHTNLTINSPHIMAALLNNQSVYAHIYVSQSAYPHALGLTELSRPVAKTLADLGVNTQFTKPYHPLASYSHTQQLNKHRPRPKEDKRKNLLSGERADGKTPEEVALERERRRNQTANALMMHVKPEDITEKMIDAMSDVFVNWWQPTLNIRLVSDFTVYPTLAGLPAEIKNDMIIDVDTNRYFPTVYIDYWWQLSNHLIPINETVTEVPLRLSYSPINQWKYRIERSMDSSWQMQIQLGTHSEAETDSLKRILLESNPYLLILTGFVSMLHMLFDMLAFKNDIAYWKNTKNTGGLSTRSLLIGFAAQCIILLYLIDNETSGMILVSAGLGLLIEAWKIRKAFDVKVIHEFPFIRLSNKQVAVDESGVALTEEDRLLVQTQKYDAEAMTYVSYALYPLMLCYFIYSLYYSHYNSWYSFILATLVGAVYTFGFIQMTPQLYINYKLKSVAHMPWRMLTYKALNTFIDDLFAFVITMPTMHRLSTFRDDIIFIIFLYQKWAYRVDDKRVNEFGVSGQQIKEAEERKAKQANKQTINPSIDQSIDQSTTEPLLQPLIRSAEVEDHEDHVDESKSSDVVDEPAMRQRRTKATQNQK